MYEFYGGKKMITYKNIILVYKIEIYFAYKQNFKHLKVWHFFLETWKKLALFFHNKYLDTNEFWTFEIVSQTL